MNFKYFGSPRTPKDPRRLVIRQKGYGRNWPKQRKAALERDNYSCVKCGRKGKKTRRRWDISVHHIRKIIFFVDENINVDYDKANDLDNLMTLCDGCHKCADGHSPLSGFRMLKNV